MARKRLTIALVCSHGGHLTEMLQLMPAFEGHNTFFFCYDGETTRHLPNAHRVPNMARNPIEMAKNLYRLGQLFAAEKPDLVVSTGAEIAIPAILMGKLYGAKSLYIECGAQVTRPSFTGRIMYYLADQFFIQWPELMAAYGPRARLRGSFIDSVAPFTNDRAYEKRAEIVLVIPPSADSFHDRDTTARLGALLQQHGFVARIVDAPGEGLTLSRTIALLDQMAPAGILFMAADGEVVNVLQHVSRTHSASLAAYNIYGGEGLDASFGAGEFAALLAWAERLAGGTEQPDAPSALPPPDWELFFRRPQEARS